jgi:ADP-ribose pyrophosphatase YjhB (NUDIX family)
MSLRNSFKFCPQCGRDLDSRIVENRSRPFCTSCDRIYFEDPKVAAAVLIEKDSQVLLVRRRISPHIGKWTLPAGFVDAGEDPIDAAVRECFEETGLTVQILGLMEVISGREHPHGADIVLIYTGKIAEGNVVAGDDVSEVALFPHDQLPPVAFKATQKALAIWQKVKSG